MFTFPTAPYTHPKELQIATLNNRAYNINYSSHKRNNNISAKHVFTTTPACETCSSLVRLFLWQDLYSFSTNAVLSQKCYVPHVCAWLAGYRSCFHMLLTYSTECIGYFPTSLMGKKIIRRGQRLHCNNSFPLCPLRHIIHNPHITNSHESSHSRHV